MSANARIAARLDALADAVELGTASLAQVRDELLGHTGAVERVPYAMVKEAQMVWGELTRAIDTGREDDIDVHSPGDWLREWALQVPTDGS